MKPHESIIKYYKDTDKMDYTHEIDRIIFEKEILRNKLEKNKLLKNDRDQLILLLNLI